MSFFTTRTSFANKLLAAAGIDLETLFKSGDVNALKAKLAGTAVAPDDVQKLFANAGLDLSAMLKAGPDSLKVHLDSLAESDAELATAIKEVARLESELGAKAVRLEAASAVITAIGLNPDAAVNAETAKIAFDAHVKKAAALEMAKSGHPPVNDIPGSGEKNGKKVMSRAAFVELSPRAQRDFCVAGGRLTE